MSNHGQHKPPADKPASAKKKKRPRIRNRKRNKCNRIAEISENISSIELKKAVEKSSSPASEKDSLKEEKIDDQVKTLIETSTTIKSMHTVEVKNAADAKTNVSAKTREEVLAEREAKKLAKQAKKVKPTSGVVSTQNVSTESKPAAMTKEVKNAQATKSTAAGTEKAIDIGKDGPTKLKAQAANLSDKPVTAPGHTTNEIEKSREQIKAEREAKKQAKQASKLTKAKGEDKDVEKITQELSDFHIGSGNNSMVPKQDEKKKPALTKAERRAIQEAQRAAKAQALAEKKSPVKPPSNASKPIAKSTATTVTPLSENSKSNSPLRPSGVTQKTSNYNVKLFNHLENLQKDVSLFVNNTQVHPSIVSLGEKYSKRTVVGSNARCTAFMNALKMVIQDFETPPKKEFSRSLEAVLKVSVEHLQKCRPLAVSVTNAHKHIKHVLTQLPTDKPESELKENLCHFIDTYIENQIGKAAQAISCSMQEKIKNGDVILTFGCSSLINYICEEAHQRKVDFRVIVVDSRPFCEGQELLRRLTAKEIPCTYVLINAVGFVMPEATKVLLGAHALLSNGYVMARTGTAQVALVAKSFNVPVLVCCETHKFSERFQTDAIVYNELGDPHDLVLNDKCCLANWQSKHKMSPLNLIYDITPPELVTAVVTEVSILPCTSVPVILRIKPTEIGYYS